MIPLTAFIVPRTARYRVLKDVGFFAGFILFQKRVLLHQLDRFHGAGNQVHFALGVRLGAVALRSFERPDALDLGDAGIEVDIAIAQSDHLLRPHASVKGERVIGIDSDVVPFEHIGQHAVAFFRNQRIGQFLDRLEVLDADQRIVASASTAVLETENTA